VDFYVPFLSAVHAGQASPDFAIVAQAHLDHFPGIRNAGSARYTAGESLAVQVQSAIELLDAVIAWSPRKIRVVLVGHSVGSWISLKASLRAWCVCGAPCSYNGMIGFEEPAASCRCGFFAVSYNQ
jgi:pimeloyl-ACP methyl ester carboxylesterase